MGKHKPDDDSELTFAPKIGCRDRKLELLKIYGSVDSCSKNRWCGRSLTSRSDERDARNYNGLLNLPSYMKSTISKMDQDSVDVRVGVASLAPLKRVPPAKKLCLGTRLYKDTLDMKKDNVPHFSSAEGKCAKIYGATSKSANGDGEQRKRLVLDYSNSKPRTNNPYLGRLSPILSASESNKISRQSVQKGANSKSDDSLTWNTPSKILTPLNTRSDSGENQARSTQSGTGPSPTVKHESQFHVQSLVRSSVEDNPDPAEDDDNEATSNLMLSRTIPQSFYSGLPITDHIFPSISADEVKNAQITVEKAIKLGKIFAIKGSWVVRKALKQRGWVEKSCFNWLPSVRPKKKKRRSSRDNTMNNDSAVDGAKSDSIDGIMSRLIRSYSPTFIWCEESACIDYRYLNKNQIVNHYERVSSFTTKVGLCKNLRNVVWFDNTDAMTFFPRCYELSLADEKAAFIDDFRLTACQSIIRHVIENYRGLPSEEIIDKEPSQDGNTVKKDGNKSAVKRKGKSDVPILPCMNCESTGWMGSKRANSHACSNNSFENACN